MNYYQKLEAYESIKADQDFHALRKPFEAAVLELMNKQHPDSEAYHTMKDYIDRMDDNYSETIELEARKAEEKLEASE